MSDTQGWVWSPAHNDHYRQVFSNGKWNTTWAKGGQSSDNHRRIDSVSNVGPSDLFHAPSPQTQSSSHYPTTLPSQTQGSQSLSSGGDLIQDDLSGYYQQVQDTPEQTSQWSNYQSTPGTNRSYVDSSYSDPPYQSQGHLSTPSGPTAAGGSIHNAPTNYHQQGHDSPEQSSQWPNYQSTSGTNRPHVDSSYSNPSYQSQGHLSNPSGPTATGASAIPPNLNYSSANARKAHDRGEGEKVVGSYQQVGDRHYEELDPSFYVRQQPRRFFVEGKVFAILFTEAAGANVTRYNDSFSKVAYNQDVYSQIRRFVVVRQRPEFCYACPVFTYSHRGTTKPGVRAKEHAIIYSEGYKPELLPGETGITKSSICVASPKESPVRALEKASRIYFGIHHPIQYNVKVKDLGNVLPHHIPFLIGYWKEENQEISTQDRAESYN